MRKKTFKVTLTIWFMIDSFPHKQPDTCVNKQQLLCLHNIDWNENSDMFCHNRTEFMLGINQTQLCWGICSLFSPQSSFIPPVSDTEGKTLCARASEISWELSALCVRGRQPEKSAQIFSRALHLTVESSSVPTGSCQLVLGQDRREAWTFRLIYLKIDI